MAITSKLFIKIPNTPRYTISKLDVAKNTLYKLNTKSEIFNYAKVEGSIQWSIQQIKLLKYGNYEELMVVLNESLKLIKGLKYYDREDHTLFSLPRSAIQPYITFNSSISLKELVEIASTTSSPCLDRQRKLVIKLIKDICSRKLTLKNGKDELLEEIFWHYRDYVEIEDQNTDSDKILPYKDCKIARVSKVWEKGKGRGKRLKDSIVPDLLPDKQLSREFLQDLFQTGQKISVTTTHHYYLIAHLTQADLSMLSDFDEITEDLNIVNGSFVTLRDPIKICGKKLHIRDTMLLAPGGRKSLAQIGRLYGEAYNKITIGKEDLNDMRSFLRKDRERFILYAIRDALIYLIHSMWMEEFKFNIGGLGVPLSLSSIGRKYVKYVWKETKYPGYQISPGYTLGDVSNTITPKGLNAIKKIGFVLPYYIANYKGEEMNASCTVLIEVQCGMTTILPVPIQPWCQWLVTLIMINTEG